MATSAPKEAPASPAAAQAAMRVPAVTPTVAPGHGGHAGHAGQGGTSVAGHRATHACGAGTPQRSRTPSKPSGRPSQAMRRGTPRP